MMTTTSITAGVRGASAAFLLTVLIASTGLEAAGSERPGGRPSSSRLQPVEHGSTVRLPHAERGSISINKSAVSRAQMSKLLGDRRAAILRKPAGGRTVRQWSSATFRSREAAAAYHTSKHGDGRTTAAYTRDAVKFKRRTGPEAWKNTTLKDGTPGRKARRKGKEGGIFTEAGRIVSFWYK